MEDLYCSRDWCTQVATWTQAYRTTDARGVAYTATRPVCIEHAADVAAPTAV